MVSVGSAGGAESAQKLRLKKQAETSRTARHGGAVDQDVRLQEFFRLNLHDPCEPTTSRTANSERPVIPNSRNPHPGM